eukprot:79960_1
MRFCDTDTAKQNPSTNSLMQADRTQLKTNSCNISPISTAGMIIYPLLCAIICGIAYDSMTTRMIHYQSQSTLNQSYHALWSIDSDETDYKSWKVSDYLAHLSASTHTKFDDYNTHYGSQSAQETQSNNNTSYLISILIICSILYKKHHLYAYYIHEYRYVVWLLVCFHILICNYGFQVIDCPEALECPAANTSTSNDMLLVKAYKSLFESEMAHSVSAETIYCWGVYSCAHIPDMNSPQNVLTCDAAFACTYTSITGYGQGLIEGFGAHSLSHSQIVADWSRIRCIGYQSCSYSTFTKYQSSSTEITADAAYALSHSNIDILAGTLEIYFRGYYAGYNATLHCNGGTICNIYCFYNGCGGLVIDCHINANCIINNETASVIRSTDGMQDLSLLSTISSQNEA